jgi:hypothetical protein
VTPIILTAGTKYADRTEATMDVEESELTSARHVEVKGLIERQRRERPGVTRASYEDAIVDIVMTDRSDVRFEVTDVATGKTFVFLINRSEDPEAHLKVAEVILGKVSHD